VFPDVTRANTKGEADRQFEQLQGAGMRTTHLDEIVYQHD
jgi:hypothetical protein